MNCDNLQVAIIYLKRGDYLRPQRLFCEKVLLKVLKIFRKTKLLYRFTISEFKALFIHSK